VCTDLKKWWKNYFFGGSSMPYLLGFSSDRPLHPHPAPTEPTLRNIPHSFLYQQRTPPYNVVNPMLCYFNYSYYNPD
jgi:hypothetical protein